MTAEVDWVLDQLASVVNDQPADHPLRRVDRDHSRVYESSQTVDMTTPIRKRKEQLQQANYVGATHADRSPDPIGTEYDHRIETVVGIRLEGAHHSEWGHIDPDGNEGVAFDTLTRQVRRTLLAAREFPDPSAPHTQYHSLFVRNTDYQLSDYSDFYRWSADVVLAGYEQLP
jgi:hypothetical protein